MTTRRIDSLSHHPLNAMIYGDSHDQELLESIRLRGILNPIVITSDNRIISGHRRYSAAKALGIETVPVFVSPLLDEIDIEEAVILSNKEQRARTKEQVAREFRRLKEIEAERARRRQAHGQTAPGKTLPLNSSEAIGDARDLAASKLGIGSQQAERAAKVVQVIDNLEASGGIEQANELREALNGQSINAAYQQTKQVVDQNPDLARPKAKPTFNATNDNIEWAKWTWNPVTGCEHGCPYCYARDIGIRFSGHFRPEFHPERLSAPANTKIPESRCDEPGITNVFVCSMADLFGDWVPLEWINSVIDQVRMNPQWNFIFLSKNPRRYTEIEWPTNAWIGATVDSQDRVQPTIEAFENIARSGIANVTFISCEPMLGELEFNGSLVLFNWVIIGGQSKTSKCEASQPKWEWVESLIYQARRSECKIYFKPNLLVRPTEYPSSQAKSP